MLTLATTAAVLLAGYLTCYVAYQTVLFAANAVLPDPPALTPATIRRFLVVIPAHNEELHLPRLLSSLQRLEYPPERYRVLVIADNCEDRTADVCRSAGVDVVQRTDPDRRGKGHAIGWMIETVALEGVDALVIVDGDSVVDAGLLKYLNIEMERGDQVVQCYNGIVNPDQSWFTQLMNVSRTVANEILHPAKRKLGLSSYLMGNGMCISTAVLRSFGWGAFTVGEDWEYYARLILSGRQVGYSRDARVYHQESMNLQQASSQRLRWSGSRFQMLRRYGVPLLVKGVRTRSLSCVDASLPLVFPNPSLAINLTFLGLVSASVAALVIGGQGMFWWFLSLTTLQLLMFFVGVGYTKNRTASALSLFMAPLFLAWKLAIDMLSFAGAGTKQWKPTARKP